MAIFEALGQTQNCGVALLFELLEKLSHLGVKRLAVYVETKLLCSHLQSITQILTELLILIRHLLLQLQQEMEGVGILAIEAVQKGEGYLGLQAQHVADWKHEVIPDFVRNLRRVLLQFGCGRHLVTPFIRSFILFNFLLEVIRIYLGNDGILIEHIFEP